MFYGSSAKAGNIVVNPGFESGIAGWTLGPSTPWIIDTSRPHSGSVEIANECVGATCTDVLTGSYFFQVLNTTIGGRYDLSFWAFFEGAPDEIKVTWGDSTAPVTSAITAIDIVNPAVLDDQYNQYYVSGLLATSTTTRLQFLGRQDPGLILGVDDISVVQNPEPSTTLLISGGLLILAGARRWRQKRNCIPS